MQQMNASIDSEKNGKIFLNVRTKNYLDSLPSLNVEPIREFLIRMTRNTASVF